MRLERSGQRFLLVEEASDRDSLMIGARYGDFQKRIRRTPVLKDIVVATVAEKAIRAEFFHERPYTPPKPKPEKKVAVKKPVKAKPKKMTQKDIDRLKPRTMR